MPKDSDRPAATVDPQKRPPAGHVYIYHLLDPRDRAVRYIGKTEQAPVRRLAEHLAGRQNDKQVHKARWVSELQSAGLSPVLEIVRVVLTKDWQQAEQAEIAAGRKRGWRLTNISDGGDGFTSDFVKALYRDPAYREAKRDAQRERAKDPAYRAKLSQTHRKKAADPEFRAKLRVQAKRLAADPEWREKNAAAAKRKAADPEWRARQAEAIRARFNDPAYATAHADRMKIRASTPEERLRWKAVLANLHADGAIQERRIASLRAAVQRNKQDPEWMARFRAAIKQATSSPEYRANLSARMRKKMEDPEYRRRAAETARANASRPESREKMSRKMLEKAKDPEYRERHRAGLIRRSEDAEYRAKITELNREKARDPNWKRAQLEGIRRAQADPSWRANVKKGIARRTKEERETSAKRGSETHKFRAMHDPAYQEIKRRAGEKLRQSLFESKVERTPDCWLYRPNPSDTIDREGRPVTKYRGRRVRADFAAFDLWIGDTKSLSNLVHTCGNQFCVRPDHLVVTE